MRGSGEEFALVSATVSGIETRWLGWAVVEKREHQGRKIPMPRLGRLPRERERLASSPTGGSGITAARCRCGLTYANKFRPLGRKEIYGVATTLVSSSLASQPTGCQLVATKAVGICLHRRYMRCGTVSNLAPVRRLRGEGRGPAAGPRMPPACEIPILNWPTLGRVDCVRTAHSRGADLKGTCDKMAVCHSSACPRAHRVGWSFSGSSACPKAVVAGGESIQLGEFLPCQPHGMAGAAGQMKSCLSGSVSVAASHPSLAPAASSAIGFVPDVWAAWACAHSSGCPAELASRGIASRTDLGATSGVRTWASTSGLKERIRIVAPTGVRPAAVDRRTLPPRGPPLKPETAPPSHLRGARPTGETPNERPASAPLAPASAPPLRNAG